MACLSMNRKNLITPKISGSKKLEYRNGKLHVNYGNFTKRLTYENEKKHVFLLEGKGEGVLTTVL